MKTIVLFKQNIAKLMMVTVLVASNLLLQAQSTTALSFTNSSLQSGTAGANDAVYIFPQVNTNTDALVKITGRSSSSVTLTSIDVTSTGYDKAFQPQVSYNGGSVSGASSWWMEFEISFVHKNTSNLFTLGSVYATGLDIDGDNSTLREFNTFYSSDYYTVENNSKLGISGLIGSLLQLLAPGKKFLGVTTDHNGIDTFATDLMATNVYTNVNKITLRVGGSTTGASSNTDRQHSIYFKNFTYGAPFTNLPVTLTSFTAALNKTKVDLKWTSATEINLSHYVIERSTDGTNFDDAGVVFAYGNTTESKDYSFSDDVSSFTGGIIYYRLRSEDIDGKSQYSATRIVRIGKQADNTITLLTYPNPVTNELQVTIPASWQNKKVTYEIFNGNGQNITKTEAASSSQTQSMNVSNLSRGLYIVRVSCDGQSAQQKVIKN